MSLWRRLIVGVGKLARAAARVRGGDGSAFPGLVVEKLNPKFVAAALGDLPYGVVVVSGTNGKTTTTKIVAELLRSQELRVFTNQSGSNFVRGVISELLAVVDSAGRLDADIAVLELDEAHAVKFVAAVKPDYALLLNVMRDQTDRFSETAVAAKLAKVAARTRRAVVVNREDKWLRDVRSKADVVYYGLEKSVVGEFFAGREEVNTAVAARLTLAKLSGGRAEFRMGNKTYSTTLGLEGMHNAYNAAAALALVSVVLPKISVGDLLTPLSQVAAAAGRGESLMVGGKEVKLILVKNAGGFELALKSLDLRGWKVAVVVNDAAADGRDVGWVGDVAGLSKLGRVAMVGGTRAEEVAGQLRGAGVRVGRVEGKFINFWRELQGWREKTLVLANYSAMAELRRKIVKRWRGGAFFCP